MFNNLRATSGKDMLIMGITLDGMRQTILGRGRGFDVPSSANP
jgi:hypothetical protein